MVLEFNILSPAGQLCAVSLRGAATLRELKAAIQDEIAKQGGVRIHPGGMRLFHGLQELQEADDLTDFEQAQPDEVPTDLLLVRRSTFEVRWLQRLEALENHHAWRVKVWMKHAPGHVKKDRELVLAAVTKYGDALRYASPELQADREIVLAAVAENKDALQHASDDLQRDGEVLLVANAGAGYAGDTPQLELAGAAPGPDFGDANVWRGMRCRIQNQALLKGQGQPVFHQPDRFSFAQQTFAMHHMPRSGHAGRGDQGKRHVMNCKLRKARRDVSPDIRQNSVQLGGTDLALGWGGNPLFYHHPLDMPALPMSPCSEPAPGSSSLAQGFRDATSSRCSDLPLPGRHEKPRTLCIEEALGWQDSPVSPHAGWGNSPSSAADAHEPFGQEAPFGLETFGLDTFGPDPFGQEALGHVQLEDHSSPFQAESPSQGAFEGWGAGWARAD